jgi:methyltransferase (TIGR00027 family)
VAEHLLGSDELALLGRGALRGALDQSYETSVASREVLESVEYVLQRTKFFDEQLIGAIGNGVKQVVVLGAGYDSRPIRFRTLLKSARVFEVDRTSTQSWKKRRLQEVFGRPPSNLTFVQADLETDALGVALESRGFQFGLSTVFLCEGVAMYLSEPGVHGTLDFVAKAGCESRIVFDYWTWPNDSATSARRPSVLDLRLDQWQEPLRFRPTIRQYKQLIARAHLTILERLQVSGVAAARRYLMRSDGSVFGRHTGHSGRRPTAWLLAASGEPAQNPHVE